MDGDASDAGTSAGPTTPHAQQQEQPLTPPRRSPPVASAEDNFTLLVSPSRKKRTKTKSRTPSASMTPRVKIRVPKHLLMAVPTMALVSDADYADFFEGESAVSTSSRIAELGQAGKTYASFRALMEDVRQQQLRASFRDQVQRAMGEDVVVMRAAYMEQVSASVNSEESERFEMRHKILFYLSSPTCPLFQVYCVFLLQSSHSMFQRIRVFHSTLNLRSFDDTVPLPGRIQLLARGTPAGGAAHQRG